MPGERCEPVLIEAKFHIALEDLQRMREQSAQLRTMTSINLQVVGQMLGDPCPKTIIMLRGVVQCMLNAQIFLNAMDVEVEKMTGTILSAMPPRKD